MKTDASPAPIAADWIAADWGSTNLRLWAMTADGEVLDSVSAACGSGVISREDYETELVRRIRPWLAEDRTTQVIICGMAGSRSGWREAPYRDVCDSFDDLFKSAEVIECEHPGLDVRILPGLAQQQPADVIRGEETQLAGFLRQHPGYDGLMVMPGTHSKWIRLEHGRIHSTRTVMTGEIFELLRTKSVLRHSVGGDEWSDHEFGEAVKSAWRDLSSVMPAMFQIRASDMLGGRSTAAERTSRLSGLLIGMELRSAIQDWTLPEIAIVGAEGLALKYKRALSAIGIASQHYDGDALVLDGLRVARRTLREAVSAGD